MKTDAVLVAEDDPSIRELIVEALTEAGLRAIAAEDGAEAVRLALEKTPAVVILDMQLPLLDGAEVAARIREKWGDAVPFVVVTARIDDASRSVRARSYVAKPFDVDDLLAAVRSALEPSPSAIGAEATKPIA